MPHEAPTSAAERGEPAHGAGVVPLAPDGELGRGDGDGDVTMPETAPGFTSERGTRGPGTAIFLRRPMSRLPQRKMKSSSPTPWARTTSSTSVRMPVVDRAMIDPSSVCSTRESMSILLTMALMSTRSMICLHVDPVDDLLHVHTVDDLLDVDPLNDLLDVDLVDKGVDVDGVDDQRHDVLSQRLGQLLHPAADRVGDSCVQRSSVTFQ